MDPRVAWFQRRKAHSRWNGANHLSPLLPDFDRSSGIPLHSSQMSNPENASRMLRGGGGSKELPERAAGTEDSTSS